MDLSRLLSLEWKHLGKLAAFNASGGKDMHIADEIRY